MGGGAVEIWEKASGSSYLRQSRSSFKWAKETAHNAGGCAEGWLVRMPSAGDTGGDIPVRSSNALRDAERYFSLTERCPIRSTYSRALTQAEQASTSLGVSALSIARSASHTASDFVAAGPSLPLIRAQMPIFIIGGRYLDDSVFNLAINQWIFSINVLTAIAQKSVSHADAVRIACDLLSKARSVL